MLNRLHNCFSKVLSDSLDCLTMWPMIETHVLLQSSGLNFGTALDLVLFLVMPITPKLMVRLGDNTEHWNRLLDVCWLSSPYLKQNGAICCVMLSLLSTQPLQRLKGALYLNWYKGNRLGYLLISL